MSRTSDKDDIAALARTIPSGIVTSDLAAAAWRLPQRPASRRLARLARTGWLRKIRRGAYQIAPLDASRDVAAPYEDPWTLAAVLFRPCHIGGWSAAEYWGLTDQLFRETFVVTAANVRVTHAVVGGLGYRLVRVSPDRATGDTLVWRATAQVACSSPERTLVDGANVPAWVGGVRHLADILVRYVENSKYDLTALERALVEYGRGAGAKRLGFLAERLADAEINLLSRSALQAIQQMAFTHRSAGVVKLDPAIRRRGHMNTAWGLWVNASVEREASA